MFKINVKLIFESKNNFMQLSLKKIQWINFDKRKAKRYQLEVQAISNLRHITEFKNIHK